MVKLIIKYRKGENKEDENTIKEMCKSIKYNLEKGYFIGMGQAHSIESVKLIDDNEQQDKKQKNKLR